MYIAVLEIGEEGRRRYWVKIEEMKAQVEPFPLVPAMWIMLSFSKSEG